MNGADGAIVGDGIHGITVGLSLAQRGVSCTLLQSSHEVAAVLGGLLRVVEHAWR